MLVYYYLFIILVLFILFSNSKKKLNKYMGSLYNVQAKYLISRSFYIGLDKKLTTKFWTVCNNISSRQHHVQTLRYQDILGVCVCVWNKFYVWVRFDLFKCMRKFGLKFIRVYFGHSNYISAIEKSTVGTHTRTAHVHTRNSTHTIDYVSTHTYGK